MICAVDPDVPTRLRGDPARLRQILVNLTGNALKFTEQGEVVVTVCLAGEADRADPSEICLRFSVTDTGIGIPADRQDRLFQQFSQVDGSTTRKYGGTGLGLAISKQLVELMGGEIGVNSPLTPLRAGEPGKGSEFWFTVPLGRQAEASAPDTLLPDLAGMPVLVVDDNATHRTILTRHLSAWGMRAVEAQDGPSALQTLRGAHKKNDPFSLAIIDMHMPDMDGAMLGRAIQEDPALAGMHMILLSPLGMRGDDVRRAENAGFAASAAKPIRYEELKTMLSRILAGRVQPATAPSESANTTSCRFADRQARILLAEDNITNQQVALGVLKKLGLSADAVANGREAVEALTTRPYDLVLMDVQMPEMDGFAATRRIREAGVCRCGREGVGEDGPPQTHTRTNSHTRIPIIAMTAHAMQGDREQCLEAGMDDYLAKPIQPQALAAVLENWLPASSDECGRQEAQEGRTSNFQGGAHPCSGHHPDPRPSPSLSRSSSKPKRRETRITTGVRTKSDKDGGGRTAIWDRAGLLRRLMDDEELAATILEGFLSDMPKQIARLKESLEAGDTETAERQAHTIKGAAASVGGEQLRALALELEQADKAGGLERMGAGVEAVVAAFDKLKEAIGCDGTKSE